MTTDITRGPRLCPSCGKENPPTAARCAFCSTPLGGAIQTTLTPGPIRLPSLPDEDAPISRPPLKGCGGIMVAFSVGMLVTVSSIVTFGVVCTGTAIAYDRISPANSGASLFLGLMLGGLAAVFVGSLVVISIYRRPRRWPPNGENPVAPSSSPGPPPP